MFRGFRDLGGSGGLGFRGVSMETTLQGLGLKGLGVMGIEGLGSGDFGFKGLGFRVLGIHNSRFEVLG